MKRIFLFLFMLAAAGFINAAPITGDSLSASKPDVAKIIKISEDSMFVAVISTKQGDIEIELYTKDAPKTTANFIELSRRGYYNGIIFHRVAKGFVIQGGDPTGIGSGGTSIYGGDFEDELDPKTFSYQDGYVRGAVAMANSGPNTNTSQFFIALNDLLQLPKNYTIFGRVVYGMDTVDKIAEGEIMPGMNPGDGKPLNPVAMDKIIIEKRARSINSIFDIK